MLKTGDFLQKKNNVFFITGADGFVGGHLCNYLKSKNIEFLKGVRSSKVTDNKNTCAYGDIEKVEDWFDAFKNSSIVVHLAARVHVINNCKDSTDLYNKINIDASFTLARDAKKYGIKKFIFLSTIKVNGETSFDKPFSYKDNPQPSDPYSFSKWEAEKKIASLHEKDVFEVIIIRPPLVYGPNAKANFGLLKKISSLGVPLPFKLINNRRSLISVYNLSDLILHCANIKADHAMIILPSDQKTYSLRDIISALAKIQNKKVYFWPFPTNLFILFFKLIGLSSYSNKLFDNLEIDSNETKSLLNWTAPFTFEETYNSELIFQK